MSALRLGLVTTGSGCRVMVGVALRAKLNGEALGVGETAAIASRLVFFLRGAELGDRVDVWELLSSITLGLLRSQRIPVRVVPPVGSLVDMVQVVGDGVEE